MSKWSQTSEITCVTECIDHINNRDWACDRFNGRDVYDAFYYEYYLYWVQV